MTDFRIYAAIAAGMAVIMVLAAYAGWVWAAGVRRRNELERNRQHAEAGKIAYLTESASRLADAMLNHDLNISEGVIRLKVMLDHLLAEADRDAYRAIYDMEEKVAGFARMEARQDMNGLDRLVEDAKREKIEKEYRARILDASTRVIEQFGAPDIGAAGASSESLIPQPGRIQLNFPTRSNK